MFHLQGDSVKVIPHWFHVVSAPGQRGRCTITVNTLSPVFVQASASFVTPVVTLAFYNVIMNAYFGPFRLNQCWILIRFSIP